MKVFLIILLIICKCEICISQLDKVRNNIPDNLIEQELFPQKTNKVGTGFKPDKNGNPDIDEIVRKFIRKTAGTTHLIGKFPRKKTFHFPEDSSAARKFSIETLLPFKIHIDSLSDVHVMDINYMFGDDSTSLSQLIQHNQDNTFRKIGYLILQLSRLKIDTLYASTANTVTYEISKLPNSLNKIRLYLKYAEIIALTAIDYSEISNLVLIAADYTSKIIDPYSRAEANILIGNFAALYEFADHAIGYYYVARIIINEADIPEKDKYYQQGKICALISDLFLFYNSEAGLHKAEMYLGNSINYFESSGNTEEVIKHKLTLTEIKTELWTNYHSYSWKKKLNADMLNDNQANLKFLLAWDEQNYMAEKIEPNSAYSAMRSLGLYSLMYNPQAALVYFLQMIRFAGSTHSVTKMMNGLRDVAFTYADLNRKSLAVKYADLSIYTAFKSRSSKWLNYGYWVKSGVYNLLKEYDSSLHYSNLSLRIIDSSNHLLALQCSPIIIKDFGLKYAAFDALNIFSDSARYFEINAWELYAEHQKNYQLLVEAESKAIIDWLDLSKNNEKEYESKLRKKAEQNLVLLVIFGTSFLIGTIIFISLIYRNKRNKLLAEKNYKNKLAINKFHNFKSDFQVLCNFLNKSDVKKSKKYAALYGKYQNKFYENWDKENIVLSDELALLDEYINVKKAANHNIFNVVTYINPNIDKYKTRFLQSVFDTLLDNTVKNSQGKCEFSIVFNVVNKILLCEVTDNGIPPEDPNSYLRRKNSGLNVLRSRLELEFQLRNKQLPKDVLIAESLPENKGTIIKMKMPYEKVT